MQFATLGRTDIRVSRICLGTMTFGEQNSREEAFRLLDQAVDAGVNFIDAAEMYPIPPKPETAGATEEIIGQWLTERHNRDRIVIATKISGPGLEHIRGGNGRYTREHIGEALTGSLRRLKTDIIDLYQLHWPERKTNAFGRLGYRHAEDDAFTAFADVLDALNDHVKAGTIRAIGVSNESPWGTMAFLALAKSGLPRIASIQNPYSLLNRVFEVGLAEIAIREQCGLLAYSPMAFGTLSGKYLNGGRPAGARLTLFPSYTRYTSPNSVRATRAYVDLAKEHGLDPAQLALAFTYTRPFLTSSIIGVTNEAQLAANIGALNVPLNRGIIEAIDAIHHDIPNPAP